MTFKKHLKLNKFMKERGRSRVRPLPSYPDQPHYNEVNSVHHYMLVLNKYNHSQSEMQPLNSSSTS
jgi:hypothetical protein